MQSQALLLTVDCTVSRLSIRHDVPGIDLQSNDVEDRSATVIKYLSKVDRTLQESTEECSKYLKPD